MLIEPIQGQGGIKVMNNAFMKELRKLCDENDILLFLIAYNVVLVEQENYLHTNI